MNRSERMFRAALRSTPPAPCRGWARGARPGWGELVEAAWLGPLGPGGLAARLGAGLRRARPSGDGPGGGGRPPHGGGGCARPGACCAGWWSCIKRAGAGCGRGRRWLRAPPASGLWWPSAPPAPRAGLGRAGRGVERLAGGLRGDEGEPLWRRDLHGLAGRGVAPPAGRPGSCGVPDGSGCRDR
jgi:hypothetical protein